MKYLHKTFAKDVPISPMLLCKFFGACHYSSLCQLSGEQTQAPIPEPLVCLCVHVCVKDYETENMCLDILLNVLVLYFSIHVDVW